MPLQSGYTRTSGEESGGLQERAGGEGDGVKSGMRKVSRAVIWICFLTVLVGSEVSAQGPREKIADETETVKTLEKSFQAALLGDEDFVCAETGSQNKRVNVKNFTELFLDDSDEEEDGSMTAAVDRFAVLDLDGDGEEEVILWIVVNDALDYGFEILRYHEGTVCGYTLGYREFMQLKSDGTFIYSGGYADWGIAKLRFSEDACLTDRRYCVESHCNSERNLEIQYLADGEPYSAAEFDEDVRRQDAKSDAVWYELTEENIKNVFELNWNSRQEN